MSNQVITQYHALKHIARVSNSALPLKKILNTIAKYTTNAIDAAGCSIMLLNPQGEHLSVVAAYGLSDLYLRKGILNGHKSLPEIMDGEIVAVADISRDERAQYPEAAQMEKISSVLGAPLMQKGDVVGEIRVYTSDVRHFSKSDEEFISAVASMIIVNLEKSELQQLLKGDHQRTVRDHRRLIGVAKLPSSSLRPSSFSHPSEEEFAKLLDFYRIEWLYEPRSFPLAWKNEKIIEMFTPDFYLPELDLYIELTTLKQSLITQKNRKLRRVKELYPEVNVKLLNKSDYLKLIAKYGYAPVSGTKVEGIDQILFSHTQIQRRVTSLAKQISQDYAGRKLLLVGILKGMICFMSDLMKQISLPVTVEFMAISYFGTDSETAVKITKDIDISVAGLDVLMVEDIVDTGMTLNYVLNHLAAHNPNSLQVCTLLDKRARRLINVPLEYIGFEVPDEFVVGYGLDYLGEYRNLPFIGVLNPEFSEKTRNE